MLLTNILSVLECSQLKENEEMRTSLAELHDNSSRGGGGGDNYLDRDGDGWCVQDGRIYQHGEDWDADSCTSCACKVCGEVFTTKISEL